jgi:hypothetical protein
MAEEVVAPAGADNEMSRALDFITKAFETWRQHGNVRGDEHAALGGYYQGVRQAAASGKPTSELLTLPARDVCWSCKGPVGRQEYCADCGAPANNDAVDSLRRLICVCHEIRKHEREHRLDLASAHGCMLDANGQIAALRRRLNGQRIPFVLPASAPTAGAAIPPPLPPEAPPERPRPAPAPRRNLLEMLLDPRSIQWLLGAGGAVLVLGLVIALWNVLVDKWVLAGLLGAANAAVLAGGLILVRFTRYQLAGRALAFLACLVMPLNLVFYHYREIITFQPGDHIWLAALVCVVLYAVTAALVRDPALAYVFVGGVALTGVLVLADNTLYNTALFWWASAQALFLTLLGIACIHVERAFPEGDGPFTRGKFGLAFFWSGHAALAVGLIIVAAAQVTGGLLYHPFYEDVYKGLGFQGQPEIVTEPVGRLLAFCIVAAACYAYVYSDLVVRKVGVYVHLAVFAFLWAEVLLFVMAFTTWPDWQAYAMEILIAALALTGLLAKVLLTLYVPACSSLRKTVPALALTLSLVPLLMGTLMHVQAVVWAARTLTWWYVAAMAVSAISCRVCAYLHQGGLARLIPPAVGHKAPEVPEPQPSSPDRWLMTIYLFGGGGSLLLAASGVVLAYDPELRQEWVWVAPVLMLIPLAYLTAARLYRGRSLETPVVWAAHAMTLVLVAICLGRAFQGAFSPLHNHPHNFALAWFFGEAAVFYLLAAVWRDREFAVYACAASAAAAIWQLLTAFEQPPEYYIGAFAALGLVLLILYRFFTLDKRATAGVGRAAFQSANALMSLAAAAGALNALTFLPAAASFLPDQEIGTVTRVVVLEILLAGASLAALFLARQRGWRRWYMVAAIANAALAVLVLVVHVQWTWTQKLEITCLVLGVAVLVLAHIGWLREHEREDDMVSFGLILGCLLTAVPLIWAVFYCRFSGEPFDTFHTINEVAMLAAGLVLFGAGGVARIKSTTITGAVMLVLYILTLPALLRVENALWQIGIYLTIGGSVFFGIGLLLAVYRDRLLALPQRIQRREGVFRVLNWR